VWSKDGRLVRGERDFLALTLRREDGSRMAQSTGPPMERPRQGSPTSSWSARNAAVRAPYSSDSPAGRHVADGSGPVAVPGRPQRSLVSPAALQQRRRHRARRRRLDQSALVAVAYGRLTPWQLIKAASHDSTSPLRAITLAQLLLAEEEASVAKVERHAVPRGRAGRRRDVRAQARRRMARPRQVESSRVVYDVVTARA
jgi:hypothetical protein